MREALRTIDRQPFAFLDLTSAFDDASASDEIFLDSYHFGDRGNRLLAERLERWVGGHSLPGRGAIDSAPERTADALRE
jgi:hypothetical protein